jgi:hypothetical protein
LAKELEKEKLELEEILTLHVLNEALLYLVEHLAIA